MVLTRNSILIICFLHFFLQLIHFRITNGYGDLNGLDEGNFTDFLYGAAWPQQAHHRVRRVVGVNSTDSSTGRSFFSFDVISTEQITMFLIYLSQFKRPLLLSHQVLQTEFTSSQALPIQVFDNFFLISFTFFFLSRSQFYSYNCCYNSTNH